MRTTRLVFALPLLGAVILYTGCESKDGRQTAHAAPPPNATAPTITAKAKEDPKPAPATVAAKQEPTPAPQDDAVANLIAQVEKVYQKGQANYQAGHLEAAKDDFDQAFDMLVKGKVGVQEDERLQDEF